MAELKQLNTKIVIRNDTAQNWTSNNPILLKSEFGVELGATPADNKLKIGDGITPWNDLAYTYDLDSIKTLINAAKPTADNVYFTDNLVFTEQFGKYIPDSTGSVTVPVKDEQMSVADLFMSAFAEEKNPEITQPSLKVTLTGAGAKEVGTEVTPNYSTTFNAGNYEYGPETGVTATSYSIRDTNGSTGTTATGTLTKFTVEDGITYNVTATVNYGNGAIPKTNLGKDYAAGKIVAGSKTATSSSITGYRNSFYGSVSDKSGSITSSVIRSLPGKKNGTVSSGSTFKAAEAVGAMRVIIAVPSPRTCTSIKDENGLNAEALSAFTHITVNVEGANGYTVKQYNVYYKDNATANDKANNWVVTVG